MLSPGKFPGLQVSRGWALLTIATACVDVYFPLPTGAPQKRRNNAAVQEVVKQFQ